MLLTASFCQQAATMSAYKFTPRVVASPDAPQQPLVRKRARSGGANWVRVTYHTSPSNAKRPRAAGSQQPACTHQEHQILTTSEAASFASQFWDRKVHPTKALQHEFLAQCIDVDLEKNVKHAQWHKYTRFGLRVICGPSSIALSCASPTLQPHLLKNVIIYPPPPTHTFPKRPLFCHRFQKVYTLPPQRDKIWAHWTKSSSNPGKVPKPTVLAHSE